jgi:hypothetical protein
MTHEAACAYGKLRPNFMKTDLLGLRLQTCCGVYVDLHVPESAWIDTESTAADPDISPTEHPLLLARASQYSSAGLLTVHNDKGNELIFMQSNSVNFQPSRGIENARRVRWQDDNTFEEISLPDFGFDRLDCKRVWRRAEDVVKESIAVLELIDDKEGRHGYWVVIGTWFGRVVGRCHGDIFDDLLCRSLSHAIRMYSEALGAAPETAVECFEASFGHVEAPGCFRITHDLDPSQEGTFLLEESERQLRRDSEDNNVIVENWSNRHWAVRELPSQFRAFGQLKRAIV